MVDYLQVSARTERYALKEWMADEKLGRGASEWVSEDESGSDDEPAVEIDWLNYVTEDELGYTDGSGSNDGWDSEDESGSDDSSGTED
jgi:hypothetical protein